MKQPLKQKVRALHQNNLTNQEIADSLQISLQKVEKYLLARVGRPKIEEWKIQQLKVLMSRNTNVHRISQQLKVSIPTIYKYARHDKPHRYELVAPDQTIHKINNLLLFCDNHQLDYRCTRRLIGGEIKQHKGWTAPC